MRSEPASATPELPTQPLTFAEILERLDRAGGEGRSGAPGPGAPPPRAEGPSRARPPQARSRAAFQPGRAPVQPRPRAAAFPPARLPNAGAATSRVAAHATTARQLQRARAGHAAEAHRLVSASAEARSNHLARASAEEGQDQLRQRLAERLEAAPPRPDRQPPAPGGSAPAPVTAGGAPAPVQPDPERAPPASRVESALRLVERIEVFLRSGRPQLELSVGGALGAEVLLERTGPGEVAVTIRGRRGPPPPAELSRVREHLRARGLKLSSLSLG